MYIRLYRVRKVFELYEEYLATQRRILVQGQTETLETNTKTIGVGMT